MASQPERTTCRLCGGPPAKVYQVREMMLGTRDMFDYSECRDCGALQRCDLDVDLRKYYPASYYAFAVSRPRPGAAAIRRLRNWLALSPRSPVRVAVRWISPPNAAAWLDIPGLNRDTRILDVGCGKGTALRQLAEAGFRNLTGVDPFLPEVVETPPSVRMIRSRLEEVSGTFDYVMFHHSLEHIADQGSAMSAAARLLSPAGYCLVRVPITSSYAWRHYRENWFQVDAPRHFVLHSIHSLTALARGAGMRVARIVYDSNETQILWSERYRAGTAMSDPQASFSAAQVAGARREARKLNSEGAGDQVAVYFRRDDSSEP